MAASKPVDRSGGDDIAPLRSARRETPAAANVEAPVLLGRYFNQGLNRFQDIFGGETVFINLMSSPDRTL